MWICLYIPKKRKRAIGTPFVSLQFPLLTKNIDIFRSAYKLYEQFE